MNKPSYIIRTPRLGLRPWYDADRAPFARLNQDPDVMRYFPSMPADAETSAAIDRQIHHQSRHGFCFWATDLLEEERFVGFIGLCTTRFSASFTPAVEIGWRVAKDYWGQGLAPEGAAACLEFARERLHLTEVYSFTPLSNRPSERVMQKIGMEHVGSFMHPLIAEGHPLQEHLLYYIRL
ncbi:MAG: GNAT family N-acetyltransferase [Saprospiraceae bacterium]|nr:GNAT family N-acetyltransferase [Saprospiraceae bacterium]